MPLFSTERHRRILQLLEQQDTLRSADLEREFEVTAMTVWRDLLLLEERGLLRRMRGGARRVGQPEEAAFTDKAVRARLAKERIAAHVAATRLQAGQVVIFDGGTTVAAVAEQPLPPRLSVLTNSLPVAAALQRHPARPSVYLSGGLLRPESGTLVGRETLSFFGRRRADLFLMSTSGIDAEAGITDPNPQEIEVKQAMAARAQRVCLLADHSKCGVISHMQTLPLRRLHEWITDAPVPPALARALTTGHTVLEVALRKPGHSSRTKLFAERPSAG